MSRWAARARTAVAALALLLVTVLRRTLPIRFWSGLLGRAERAPVELARDVPLSADERLVALALRAGSRRLPFPTSCLDRAAAGSLLLRARGRKTRIVVGVNAADPRQGSHAWLVGESGAVVVGREVMADFAPVTQFVRR